MTIQRPLIGLTGRRVLAGQVAPLHERLADLELDLYFTLYAKAVSDAGGIPLHLPLDVHPSEYVGILHGILLSGGADVDPGRYGQANTASHVEPLRDHVEFGILEYAVDQNIPTLGICRGHQVLNVFAGGTLDQDIPEHAVYDKHASSEVHKLSLSPDSEISRIYHGTTTVNSLHHQRVDEIGKGLVATAWSEDGTVEALEMTGKDIISVQWHPEMLNHHEPVFDWLVGRARDRMAA